MDSEKKQIFGGSEQEDMSSRVCREYQENIRKSDALQSEILMGIKAGMDTYHLFLMAVEAISLMTGNSQFYTQVERDCRNLYGDIFGLEAPLEDRLHEAEERMKTVQAAADAESDIEAKDRLTRCITAHQELIKSLKQQIREREKK